MAMYPPGQHIVNINIDNIHFVYYFLVMLSIQGLAKVDRTIV